MTPLLFDCDGVLVDSEPISVTELAVSLRDAGADISDAEVFARMIGRPINEIVAIIRDEQGVDATPRLSEYRGRVSDRFEAELRAVPGIARAIRALPPGPRAVASSSTPQRLEQMLRLTGLWDDFAPHVYSASEVERGKPAPDLFLFAARKLGVNPADCVVIEDSPAGIRAARSAGMRVIAFLGGSHAEAAGLARQFSALSPDAVIADPRELSDTLSRLAVSA
ncbi:HAD family hydrolase [Paracoccus aurantiacus]|uniref:HAD family hydrolase n=1 Tax=Paracoccus aurantiacus TaxID=2599412 RepID=A0A5C6S5D4_9RHOB|nr:HAD family hydrolase [Paracoccus aurantiacus]TXB69639.1 HAD family hydrolase [Paracoccus aurantiacus]